MKLSFIKMSLVALTVWLGLVAGTASAGIVTLSGSSTTGYAGTFGEVVSGAFNNTYSFPMPVDSSASGGANTVSMRADSSFSFSALNLYSDALLKNLVSTGSMFSFGVAKYAELSFSNLAAPATYYLNVIGHTSKSSASYAGNIKSSTVPEPVMYGSMLVGLALVGFSARRRNQNS